MTGAGRLDPRRSAGIRALIVLAVVICTPAAVGQGVIELRSSVRIAAGTPVLLEQVATLEGPDAEALAKAVVLQRSERAQGEAVVSQEQVRASLRSAGRPNWARLVVRGAACRVLPEGASPLLPRPALAAAPKAAPPVDPAGTIRAAVILRVAQVARAPVADLRLAFSPEDDAFLNQAVSGRTLEIRPTAASERLPLAITIYEGDRIVASQTIRVGVEARRLVAVAAAPKRRGDDLGKDDFTVE